MNKKEYKSSVLFGSSLTRYREQKLALLTVAAAIVIDTFNATHKAHIVFLAQNGACQQQILLSTALASSNPLLNASILEAILGYVGPGHHLLLATVSRLLN
jgi:hypothetical protein